MPAAPLRRPLDVVRPTTQQPRAALTRLVLRSNLTSTPAPRFAPERRANLTATDMRPKASLKAVAAVMDKPIPAFYCCYLLRSTVKPASLYVGSTPNPLRRLRQHNGLSTGGATRTDREQLRPWEMACIVTGFPSKIAALQFEWAWQNTHITRHIPAEDRITAPSKKGRKKVRHPSRLPLKDRISNLHLLLRVKSFYRWPLHVTFFAEDVYCAWKDWTKSTPFKLRSTIGVQLEKADAPEVCQRPDAEKTVDTSKAIGNGKGIEGIDVSYESLKAYLEKSRVLLEEGRELACVVCEKQMQAEKCVTLVCPHDDCQAISHMTCLSEAFLRQEGNPDAIMPLQGTCPSCGRLTQWPTLMKELSLRIRGEKEIASLCRKRKRRAASNSTTKASVTAAVGVVGAVSALESDGSSDESEYPDIENGLPHSMKSRDSPQGSDGFEDIDEWYHQRDGIEPDSDTDIDMDEPQKELRATATLGTTTREFSPIVIEDSDWDDAEELD
ncbi:giy-yig catalytic domain-containing protein [Diplodia corticola]|uniref:Giy-yig catalytic domain-containing protein n=1 Tax=Diplodia corticola TaxID=236234 RepID=A0A1J9RXF8_9PEZI|nr:giy-yig catalytic domain-containing protein [Diplodia corticola]OJD33031.1 giy-yig catalytic domain-containing protein [Diplodia corticola]